MSDDRARRLGQFRFDVISPLLSDDAGPLYQRFAHLADQVWTLPNGQLRQYSAATIEDWYYDYRQHGLSALINPPRRDKGTQPAISETIINEIDAILAEHPAMKAANIIRLLDQRAMRADGKPSDSSLYRYVRRRRPQRVVPQQQERRAFEAPYAGALYQVDIMYGPHLRVPTKAGGTRSVQTYLLAVIDDFSRLICHGEFFLQQNLMTYIKVLENAVRKRGIPDKIYCDNGKVFLSEQVKRIGAEIGSRVVHTAVRDAAAKGKIERFFKTVRDQFLDLQWAVEKTRTLERLNRCFGAWVEQYNNRPHSALDCSPLEKWLRSPRPPRLLTDHLHADELFLLEVQRTVKNDGTFWLGGNRYETLYSFARKKVTVRYDAFDPTRVHVYHQEQYLGVARPLDIAANDGVPRDKGNNR